MDFDSIWKEAEEAGAKAIKDFSDTHGHDERAGGFDSGACGFAWITIRPARGKFVNWCKAQNKTATAIASEKHGRTYPVKTFGDNGWNGGWVLWSPGAKKYRGQSVDTYEVAARGFAGVLRKHGIDAHVGSRLD